MQSFLFYTYLAKVLFLMNFLAIVNLLEYLGNVIITDVSSCCILNSRLTLIKLVSKPNLFIIKKGPS